MEELRELLIKNNYPQQVIDKEFDKFEKYKMLNVDKIPNPNEKIKYLSIPFINDKSEIIGRKIQEAVKEHFTNINLRVAFKSPATLGSHFPFKDKVTDFYFVFTLQITMNQHLIFNENIKSYD